MTGLKFSYDSQIESFLLSFISHESTSVRIKSKREQKNPNSIRDLTSVELKYIFVEGESKTDRCSVFARMWGKTKSSLTGFESKRKVISLESIQIN